MRGMREDFLHERLEVRNQNGTLRFLSRYEGQIDFCSNDYLGLALDTGNIHSDLPKGSGASRLISGNPPIADETEAMIAAYHGAEAALVFNSGYTANLGLFQALGGRNDTFIHDEYIHASILDGIRLSGGRRMKFRHNDMQSLEAALRKAEGRIFVAAESLYSMDGDLAPLIEISSLCRKHSALLIVDEAHAAGLFGSKGQGLASDPGLNIFARIITYGKAFGLHGAAVLGSETLRNYLINFARPFIYSTAPSPDYYANLQHRYRQMASAPREALFRNIALFHEKMHASALPGWQPQPGPIQLLLSPNAKRIARSLNEKGFAVKAILPPTVPEGAERIRISLHSFNTPEQIGALAEHIKSSAI